MSLHSFFEAHCKHCGDNFSKSTGSNDECNRCRTLMTLMAPLSIQEIEKLLNAMAGPLWGKGRFEITWKEAGATKRRPRR